MSKNQKVKQVPEKYEYKTITNVFQSMLQIYDEILPRLWYEMLSLNSHVSWMTSTTVRNDQSWISWKNNAKIQNNNYISTSYTLSLRRNIQSVPQQILDITEEYLEIIRYIYLPQKSLIKEAIKTVLYWIPIFFAFALFWPLLVWDILLKIHYNFDAVMSMILFLIVIIGFTFLRMKPLFCKRKKYKESLVRFHELEEILEKY